MQRPELTRVAQTEKLTHYVDSDDHIVWRVRELSANKDFIRVDVTKFLKSNYEYICFIRTLPEYADNKFYPNSISIESSGKISWWNGKDSMPVEVIQEVFVRLME